MIFQRSTETSEYQKGNNLLLGFPSLTKPEGPKIFLSRLKESIEQQKLARATHYLNPLHDVSLFTSVARPYYRKPYILRLDGIYMDSLETLGSNKEKNAPIMNAIKNAKGLIFQSEYSKRIIEYHFGKINKAFEVIPNGICLDKFKSKETNYRSKLGIPNEARVLLTSGSWRTHKRLDALVRLFLILLSNYDDLYLIVIGPDAHNNITHKRIHYTGFLQPNEIFEWYCVGDIYIFLSWLDNCPNTVIEALACGMPVLCTNQGGTKELVELTNGGIVAEADKIVPDGLVDLYHPPKPNMDVLLEAGKEILEHLEKYRSLISTEKLDINLTARRYINFIQYCCRHN